MGESTRHRSSGTPKNQAQDGKFNLSSAAAASRRPEPEELFQYGRLKIHTELVQQPDQIASARDLSL